MNTFRNWHRPAKWYRTKEHKLSDMYPARAQKSNKGIEVSFEDEWGNAMRFTLTQETAEHLQERLTEAINKTRIQKLPQ